LMLHHHPSQERRDQVQYKLEHGGFDETAEFCAYFLQCEHLAEPLGLRPWHPPPSSVDLRSPEDVACPSGQLLLRMLDLGISRYHPDPLAALASAERRATELSKRDVLAAASNITPLRHGAVPPPEDAA
jgi:hypothetical protein